MKSKALGLSIAVNIILLACVLLLAFRPAPETETVEEIKTNNTLEIIHQRKSVRNYTGEKVSKADLETLVKAGMAAPTVVNRQPWKFIIVDDEALITKLGEALPYAQMVQEAGSAIVVCGDMEKALDGIGKDFWIQDCSAASENILLAAESMGLGAVWTAAYPSEENINIIREILLLPENIVPLNLIPVGYPVGDEKPKDKWKPENMKWNQY